MSDASINEVRMTPYTFAPKGWAFCNGQLISRSQNASLFQINGTSIGEGGMVAMNANSVVPIVGGQTHENRSA